MKRPVFLMVSFPRVALGLLLLSCRLWAASVEHVVHLSIDGLGGIHLQSYLEKAPANFPNFVRLKREGAFTFNARCDFHISETVPNHLSIVTGRPVSHGPAAHGYITNAPGPNDVLHRIGNAAVPYKASVFDVVHDHGKSTGFVASKARLEIIRRSYSAQFGAADATGVDDGRNKISISAVGDLAGPPITNLVNAVVQSLRSARPVNYLFVHLSEPDLTAHTYGWNSPQASNMVQLVDREIGRILDAINESEKLKGKTAVILTSDHGGGGGGFPLIHTAPEFAMNYTIPFFLWGPGIAKGVDAYTLFENRADPGPKRPGYAMDPQPLRNGDSANIALHLLGLPPTPGSIMLPKFRAPEQGAP